MISTILKNQIIYRYGLDIFHNLSDFKTLVSDVKNIADNVGMDWKICFGLCPTSDLIGDDYATATSNRATWPWANFLQDGWQYSKETGENNLHFLNMPVSESIVKFSNELPSFYCYNIGDISDCNNNNNLTNWLSFKQILLGKLCQAEIGGDQTDFSYPYFGKYNKGTNDNPDWEYYFYAQRCSIIFFLEEENNANSAFIIDCFCGYQYVENGGKTDPRSFYIVGTYGTPPNTSASLRSWLTNPSVNSNAYGTSGSYCYEVKTLQDVEAEQFTPCYLKYTYFCGEKTAALSKPFFVKESVSLVPQNRTKRGPNNSSWEMETHDNTIPLFFSELHQGSNQDGYCILESNGEPVSNSHIYMHCYTNHPWVINYCVNEQSTGRITMVIPNASSRAGYPYNGLSQFKDATGRYTPHLYKKFWGGRELYDCFILEDANGNIKKMFGGSFFCIDFADEEEENL
jgi:hypothetical protein